MANASRDRSRKIICASTSGVGNIDFIGFGSINIRSQQSRCLHLRTVHHSEKFGAMEHAFVTTAQPTKIFTHHCITSTKSPRSGSTSFCDNTWCPISTTWANTLICNPATASVQLRSIHVIVHPCMAASSSATLALSVAARCTWASLDVDRPLYHCISENK